MDRRLSQIAIIRGLPSTRVHLRRLPAKSPFRILSQSQVVSMHFAPLTVRNEISKPTKPLHTLNKIALSSRLRIANIGACKVRRCSLTHSSIPRTMFKAPQTNVLPKERALGPKPTPSSKGFRERGLALGQGPKAAKVIRDCLHLVSNRSLCKKIWVRSIQIPCWQDASRCDLVRDDPCSAFENSFID